MLDHLADVSIRSLLLALPAALVLWILRSRRTAALQHAVWAAVVYGMLALFAFGQVLPRLPLRILDGPAPVQVTAPAASVDGLIPPPAETLQLAAVTAKPHPPIGWRDVVIYAYGVIAFAFLAHFVTGMFLVRKLLATAHSVSCDGWNRVYESGVIVVPLTVGWLRPRILLPLEWRDWAPEKLEAVLAHEGAHARRHDGLVTALAGLNKCVFWFHPLAWMLERKLALLAEQACDESCVAALGDRRRYADLLLEMAAVVDGSQGRLRRHALTMAAGSHIRQRIDSLLQEGRTFSRGLTWAGWAAVMLGGIPLVLCAGAVQLARRPSASVLAIPASNVAPSPLPRQKAPEKKPLLLAQTQAAPAQAATPQAPAATTPKFDTASVRRCLVGDGNGRSGRGGGGGRGIPISPAGNLYINCLSLWEMVDIAYAQYPDEPLINDSTMPMTAGRIRGGPAWIHSDYYTIDAKTDDPVANGPNLGPTPANTLMRGAMLRALLEDRFQLKTHRGVEQVPMYTLTVASGGLKMQPMEEGGCTPHDPTKGLLVSEMFPPGQKPLCVNHLGWNASNWTLDAAGQSLDRLAGALSTAMDRHVLDKTGITSLFTFHLVFAHDDKTPGNVPDGMPSPFPPSDTSPGPSVFTVLEQQLGLTLAPDTGPHGFIVIDSVERPVEN
jgi:uncharacterized protein (TIGR03435 family)